VTSLLFCPTNHPALTLTGTSIVAFRIAAHFLRTKKGKVTCPFCTSGDIRYSHRKNPLERILTFIRLRPFRCTDCRSRFWGIH
jgi:transposase-like protein